MNKVQAWATGTAVVLVLGAQQYQISQTAADVNDIKEFLITSHEKIRYTAADKECLAKNIYYEAGVEDIRGKFAVAQVTINRLKAQRWGNSICKVVHAPKQFSWTLRRHHEKPRGDAWEHSRAVAAAVLSGVRVAPLKESTLYHASYVRPYWVKSVVKIQQVGQHIFYKTA
jgi:spore germination cell wall hydrolase CwlJ-like protein